MADTKLLCVNPQHVELAWPAAKKYILRAIKRTDLADATEIESRILAGKSLLWLACNGMAIVGAGSTELSLANGRKYCEITAYGGDDRSVWLHLVRIIEDYAKAEGCTAVRLMGRRGWARLLKDYAVTSVVMERRI